MSDPLFAESSLQRRPIPGFEEYYEITRRGDVYSRRLHRFIKQSEQFVDGRSVIEFQIDNTNYRLPIAHAVAAAFLTADDEQEIISAVPELHQLSPRDLKRHAAVPEMSERHNVAPAAILAVLREAQRAARR